MDKPYALIVDASRTVRSVIRAEFDSEAFEVIEADNGDDALKKARELRPAIITLSMVLPPTDGLAVCRALASEDCLSATSVIMITSRDVPDEESRAFEAGAMRFVNKGFKTGELKVYVDEIKRKRGSLADVTVLAVDDSAFIRNSISRALGLEKATVYTAEDGSQVLPMLDKHDIDVIVTDYHMPNVDGLELVKLIQDRREYANVPILFLTVSEDRGIVVRALDAGATDFVRKPFDATELLARIRSLARLAKTTKRLSALASTDELTGLMNRREAMKDCAELCASNRRYETNFSCIVIDLDFFKKINDSKGHAAGDYVLKEISCLFKSTVRETDGIYRIGGEEFLVLLPHSDESSALLCAEKMRKVVEDHRFVFNGETIPVTISGGVARFDESMGNEDVLLQAADAALYEAKESGRNCVSVAKELAV
ncbi:response regulator [bacterium AH-315-J04]|nr:response regulator [bacterium AH-315-J04]